MILLLAFSVLLLFAVQISKLANRTILSTAGRFPVGGFVLGSGSLVGPVTTW